MLYACELITTGVFIINIWEIKTYVIYAPIHIRLKPRSYSTGLRRRSQHDDVTKRKHIPRYWPFVRGIHRSPASD